MRIMTNQIEQLTSLIRAGWPGILVQSTEETRVDRLLAQVADAAGLAPKEWNLGYGWVRFNNKQPLAGGDGDTRLSACLPGLLDEDLDGKLLVIKGATPAMEQDALAVARLRQLLNRIERHHRARCAVVLLSERAALPPEIEPLVALLPLSLPGRAEIEAVLAGFCTEHDLVIAPVLRPMVAAACSGLSELELRTVLMTATGCGTRLDDTTVEAIIQAKERIIAKSGVLEMVAVRNGIDDIGGLDDLKRWLQRRAAIVQRLDEAEAFGVKAPKGVLIAGMPGCGKSLTAKVAAGLFRLPLLRLDIGSLLGKYVGESEHNMRRALQMAETVSPCVLWVDELEKAFVGLGSGASEVSTRLLGYFLTWMQEKSAAVFVIATANDVTALPAELLRKGRFDEIFYVGFPNTEERTQILRIHLEKARQPAQQFDLVELAAQCRDYTGADIESAINEALENAFIEGVPLTQSLLKDAICATVPLRETLRDKVGQYEELFEKLKLKPASGATGMSVARMIRQADDPNQIKREEVAAHLDCPDNLLEKLVKDSEFTVREAAYRNPRCPEHLLSMRINIGKDDPAYDDTLLTLACTHPNAPHDLLVRLIGEGRFPNGLRNAIFQASVQPEKMWEEFWPWRSKEDDPEAIELGCAFALNRKTSETLQQSLCNWSRRPELRRQLARNPRLASSVQQALLQDEDKQVRLVLAGNPAKTLAVQLGLAEDADLEVRAALAGERDLCAEVQCKLAGAPYLDVRLALAENWSLVEEVQCMLAEDAFPSVRKKVAGEIRLGERAQLQVAKGKHADAKHALLRNWDCKLAEAAQRVFADDPDPEIRLALIRERSDDLAEAVKQHLVLNNDLDIMTATRLYDFLEPDQVPEPVIRRFVECGGLMEMRAADVIYKRSVLSRELQLHLIDSGGSMLLMGLAEAVCRLEPEMQARLEGDIWVDRAQLAARMDLVPEVQARLARHKDEEVREALRANPVLTEEARRILAEVDLGVGA
jgi:AAA+ superfamily predicted ATPase